MVIRYDLMQYIIISMKSILLKNALTLEVNYWQVLTVLFGFGGEDGVTLFLCKKTRNVFFWSLCVVVFVIFPTLSPTRVQAYRPPEIKSY